MKATFRRASLVLIAGDSVYTDNGEGWGIYKPGSEYSFMITTAGELYDFLGPDSLLSAQNADMMQRFFPLLPANSIEDGHIWDETMKFDLLLTGRPPVEVTALIRYVYRGRADSDRQDTFRFDYNVEGMAADSSAHLAGSGSILFDNRRGLQLENTGDFIINAVLDVSMFGIPIKIKSGVPVEINSRIRINFDESE